MHLKHRVPFVSLVSLPWTCLNEPSLGLGILRSVLDREKIDSRILHVNVFLLEYLKADTYYALADVYALNDFLFSGVLDPIISQKQKRLLRYKTSELLSFGQIDEKKYGGLDGVVKQLVNLRHKVIPQWLDSWAEQIAGSETTLIALTCMFDQTIASLALAHLVKQKTPEKLISLGGYAVRSPTGEAILSSFPCVDVISLGEGEPVIAKLARASVGQISLRDVPSILFREEDGTVCRTQMAPLMDMNDVPVPNYDDFFADIKHLSEKHEVEIKPSALPIDNSRGCWWGQKKHCIFCGIHDDDLTYRFRNADRVIEVMNSLANKYGISLFRFSDYILPYQYFDTLFPKLADMGSPYRIAGEMKANIDAERFVKLADAGVIEVQPGIESFSSDVLRKMDKGVSAVQNVYTLLLGKLNSVTVRYNILYGLPNDDLNEVDAMVNLLPRLKHLQPPVTRLPTLITRYAPLQVTPERFEIDRPKYETSYDLIFSAKFLRERNFNLNDFCYYFERPYENSPRLNRLYLKINQIVDDWQFIQSQREVSLWYEESSEGLKIFDSRSEPSKWITLDKQESLVYLATIKPISLRLLRKRFCKSLSLNDFSHIMKRLDQLGLVFQESDSIIGLVLPKEYMPHRQ